MKWKEKFYGTAYRVLDLIRKENVLGFEVDPVIQTIWRSEFEDGVGTGVIKEGWTWFYMVSTLNL